MITKQVFLKRGGGMTLAIALPAGLLACLAGSAAAQAFPVNPAAPDHIGGNSVGTQSEGLEGVGRTADTGIGEVGERTEVIVNADPMGRLNSRIQSRVQNRIRNRIDRNYDPMANATSPFERAEQQTRRSLPR